jgi:NTE family protein
VDAVEFRNGTKISDDVFRPFISQKIGAAVDPVALQTDLARIYGFGYFEFINYHVAEREGKNVLVIDAPRKSWGPDYLRLGLQIAEEFDGDSAYALKARYQKTELNRLGGEMNLDGDIGTNSRAQAEWYQPIGKAPRWMSYGAPYFTSLQGSYGQENDPVFLVRGSELPFTVVTGEVSPAVGRTLGNWGRAKAGIKWDWETYKSSLARGAGETVSRSDGFVALDIDTLDDAGFPRQGTIGVLEARAAGTALGGDSAAALFQGDLGGARSWGPHTFQARARYGTNLNPEAEIPFILRLGGFLNLSGYSHNSLIGAESALGQLRWNRRAGSLASFPFYLGTALEWGGTWNRRRDITLSSGYWSGSLYAALDSGLGPAYLAYSMSEQAIHTVYFYVGQAF